MHPTSLVATSSGLRKFAETRRFFSKFIRENFCAWHFMVECDDAVPRPSRTKRNMTAKKSYRRSGGWVVRLAGLAGVVLASAALAGAPSSASADDAACGAKENPCPLQKWMRANMGAALAAGDLPSLAKSLDKAGTLAPDASWATWGSFAKAGADGLEAALDELMPQLAAAGVRFAGSIEPSSDGRPSLFVHPSGTGGMLIELVEGRR